MSQATNRRDGWFPQRWFDHNQRDLDPVSLPWLQRTVLAVMDLPPFEAATAEDIRHMLRSRGHDDPPSTALWGHLMRMLTRRAIVIESGWKFPNRHPAARGRRTRAYIKEK